MTDLEISKALALAIGWDEDKMRVNGYLEINVSLVPVVPYWRVFDYRDWNVVGPISERYNTFTRQWNGEWHSTIYGRKPVSADTTQKAIALAVIEASK